MKLLSKQTFVFALLTLFVVSCSKDKSTPSISSLNNEVATLKLVDDTYKTPTKEQVTDMDGTCTACEMVYYKDAKQIGTWDSFAKNFTDVDKANKYQITESKFIVTKTISADNTLKEEFAYSINTNGSFVIDGVEFIAKIKDNKLLLFFDVASIHKASDIFLVTLDNTYGKSLEKEGAVKGYGKIELTIGKKATPSSGDDTVFTAHV